MKFLNHKKGGKKNISFFLLIGFCSAFIFREFLTSVLFGGRTFIGRSLPIKIIIHLGITIGIALLLFVAKTIYFRLPETGVKCFLTQLSRQVRQRLIFYADKYSSCKAIKCILTYLQTDTLFNHMLVPTFALGIYFYSFDFLFNRYGIKDGVNFVFITRLRQYFWLLFGFVCLAFFVALIFQKNKQPKIFRKISEISVSDLLLLLLPLSPIVQYLINNQEFLSYKDILSVLAIFSSLSLFYFIFIPFVLGFIGSVRTMMSLGLSFVFTIVNMALLTKQFKWFGMGSLKIQLLFFAMSFIVIWFMNNKKLKQILYLFVVISFVANSGYQWAIQSSEAVRKPPESIDLQLNEYDSKLRSVVEDKIPVTTPNVYFLVFESYVANETMLGYGINNSLQESYLIDQDFKLYPHSYTIHVNTTPSISRVFNLTRGENFGNSRIGPNGTSIVHNIFRNLGYKNYGLFSSDYFFRNRKLGSGYDYTIPKLAITSADESFTASGVLLTKAILLGEFRFDISWENIPHVDFVDAYLTFFENPPSEPFFVYLHTNLPGHSQFIGECRPNETELYETGLTQANLEMRDLVQLLVEKDPSAIIVVAGDHGPYLTKNCFRTTEQYDISEISRLDVQDRHGNFLAIRWPTDDYVRFDDIVVFQDLFPVIFAYMYDDVEILDAKTKPIIIDPKKAISGVNVEDGIIIGGEDDGEPLFIFEE